MLCSTPLNNPDLSQVLENLLNQNQTSTSITPNFTQQQLQNQLSVLDSQHRQLPTSLDINPMAALNQNNLQTLLIQQQLAQFVQQQQAVQNLQQEIFMKSLLEQQLKLPNLGITSLLENVKFVITF